MRNFSDLVKENIKDWPKHKRIIWLVFNILAPISGIILLIYSLTLYGTADLLRWTNIVLYLIVIVEILSIGTPLFALLDFLIADIRKKTKRVPSKGFWTISLIGVIFPSFLWGYIGIVPLIRIGNSAPQLLISGHTGAHNIPDLAVTFRTESPSINTLHYGVDPSNLDKTYKESVACQNHALVLKDLLPNTTYYYKINDQDKIYNFTTMPGVDDNLVFSYTSDCHFGAGTNNKTATTKILENALNHNISAFFFGGDFVEMGMIDSMWKEGLATISPYTTSMPFRPVVGNHDVFFGGISKWKDYFSPEGLPNDSNGRTYFRIDINNIHFFILDLEWDTHSYTEAQKSWFESEIAKIPKSDWTIVMDHAMFYTSGIYTAGKAWWDIPDMISTFEPIFKEYDVDMVFSGHNHHLEVLNDSNIIYNVVGGFGGIPDPVREHNGTGSLWYLDHQFGFAVVNITGNMATITYRTPEYRQLYSITLYK
ncbi:MAG: metallophosphoesterase [Promethearchaeota archaeon]